MRSCAIGLSVVVAAGAAAEPSVTFSFASDVNSDGPTFRGDSGNGVVDTLRNPLGLLVDDANGPLPTLSFDDTRFYADFQLTHDSSILLGTGQTLHTYRLDGSFRFDAVRTMRVDIENGLFTALGDSNSWGSSATIQASSDSGSTVTYTWQRESYPAYSLFQGASTQDNTDASFTLTNLLSFTANGTAPGVDLDAQTFLPSEKWQSEGSYSGSAFFIPAPASVVMLGLGGAVAARRRR